MKNSLFRVRNFVFVLWRLMQWKVWRSVPLDFTVLPYTGIDIPRDQEAVPRTDPHWRGQWKWVVCEFSPNLLAPSYVYFSTYAFRIYRYSRAISTRYVAFRIGPENVTFFALKKSCGAYEENTLTQISRVLERKSLEKFLLDTVIHSDDVTWV